METAATDLTFDDGRCSGVVVQTPQGRTTIEADLVVACDGRHSALRERAGLPLREIGAPIDVLWMRLSKKPDDPEQTFGSIVAGGILVAIDRGDYFQCAFVIRKGGFQALQSQGLDSFRTAIGEVAPFLRNRVGEIRSWDDVKLLAVRIARLERWYRPGLLCIGDAAHPMSPIGGVGINLAIADAVAAANILGERLRHGAVDEKHLRALQHRRVVPTRITQWLQATIQERVLSRILNAREPIHAPQLLLALRYLPPLRAIPAYVVGMGVRPEHVRSGVRPRA
jgi:2-polyprenyl-6-methoxyphenol hydroxylase-like FAD-dependent oxidoreductase